MNKNYTFFCLMLLLCTQVFAQQEPMQTQFMYNKLAWNPGFAGSFASPTLTLNNRHQWLGIEGAPNLQAISFSQPLLSNHFGLGFNLTRNAVTINRNLTFEVSYAYQIALQRGIHVGIGIQASMRHFRQNWADERLSGINPLELDPAVPAGIGAKLVPNFGTGVYVRGLNWYAGVAAPRLVSNNIDLSQSGGILSREVQHFNGMVGYNFFFGENSDLILTPQCLIKYVLNAPIDADINLTAEFKRKFLSGFTYRVGGDTKNLGESLDVFAGMQINKHLMFMVSYDIGLTRLAAARNGSMEATFRWYINPPEGYEVDDPSRPD
jgi:type IX secretion system PorP/SprF family membrane protein